MGICSSSQREKKINRNNIIKKGYFKKIYPIGKGGFGIVRINIIKLYIRFGKQKIKIKKYIMQ